MLTLYLGTDHRRFCLRTHLTNGQIISKHYGPKIPWHKTLTFYFNCSFHHFSRKIFLRKLSVFFSETQGRNSTLSKSRRLNLVTI